MMPCPYVCLNLRGVQWGDAAKPSGQLVDRYSEPKATEVSVDPETDLSSIAIRS